MELNSTINTFESQEPMPTIIRQEQAAAAAPEKFYQADSFGGTAANKASPYQSMAQLSPAPKNPETKKPPTLYETRTDLGKLAAFDKVTDLSKTADVNIPIDTTEPGKLHCNNSGSVSIIPLAGQGFTTSKTKIDGVNGLLIEIPSQKADGTLRGSNEVIFISDAERRDITIKTTTKDGKETSYDGKTLLAAIDQNQGKAVDESSVRRFTEADKDRTNLKTSLENWTRRDSQAKMILRDDAAGNVKQIIVKDLDIPSGTAIKVMTRNGNAINDGKSMQLTINGDENYSAEYDTANNRFENLRYNGKIIKGEDIQKITNAKTSLERDTSIYNPKEINITHYAYQLKDSVNSANGTITTESGRKVSFNVSRGEEQGNLAQTKVRFTDPETGATITKSGTKETTQFLKILIANKPVNASQQR